MKLTFDRDFDPRYGEAVTVAQGVRRVTARNPGPFTFRGTNTFLIGDGPLIVIDPGPDDPRHLDAILRAARSVRIEHILITHSHADHVSAVPRLAKMTGARIMAAEQIAAKSSGQTSSAVVDSRIDSAFRPDEVLEDGAFITVGDYRLEAVATPGHASDHLAFALLGSDILFSGDHVMGWSTTVVAPPDGSMADYMRSLDRLLARPEQLYSPAHGGEIHHAHHYVSALREHRQERERAIIDALRSGDTTIDQIVARVYSSLDARLTAAASLSTLAHLEDLVARGLVVTEEPPSLSGAYRPMEAMPVAPAASGG
jgi:glyoxylase-like metal-dependent hydrolase (beta-lactamase superfamily II)